MFNGRMAIKSIQQPTCINHLSQYRINDILQHKESNSNRSNKRYKRGIQR